MSMYKIKVEHAKNIVHFCLKLNGFSQRNVGFFFFLELICMHAKTIHIDGVCSGVVIVLVTVALKDFCIYAERKLLQVEFESNKTHTCELYYYQQHCVAYLKTCKCSVTALALQFFICCSSVFNFPFAMNTQCISISMQQMHFEALFSLHFFFA